MDSSGNLYGTTHAGGAGIDGTVFKLAHGSHTITTLALFVAPDGSNPYGGVIMDSSGNLYGTASGGGASGGYGTVFELAHGSDTITVLASFNGTDGSNPYAGLIMDSSGNLYGTTQYGGPSWNGTTNLGYGTVFELAHGSGTISTLASFNGTNGANPYVAVLIMDSSGNLYGTAPLGGASGAGTVFELAHGSGTIAALASFNSTNGVSPYAALIMDSSGNLYGTTIQGGASNDGTVFEVAHGSGTITTLASFGGFDGAYPWAALIMDSSGNLYGTTGGGGDYNDGTVFELAHGSGTVTTLASLNAVVGQFPEAGLIMDSGGNLYGTAHAGSSSNDGTVFELAHGSGTITTLASFNGTDGANPRAALIMDSSGNLYGTTEAGGLGLGTVFELPGAAARPSLQISGLPSSTGAGVAQTFTVTVPNAVGTTDSGYTGTVNFTSADSAANLPADNAVTALDNGRHPFSGFALKKTRKQSITATDVLFSSITGSLSVNVP